ncbi:MAG: hypothetical protein MPN21_00115 [Thermoanaerobaculia bacterium]|nr:hypothetical protein [Thermoanaerobaculia bacterium]
MKLGIEFFPPDTPPEARRRRKSFLVVWLLVGAMVVWPLFPWLGARQTLVFGLPASIAWVALALLIQFVALLWLYLGEEDRAETTGEHELQHGSVAAEEG